MENRVNRVTHSLINSLTHWPLCPLACRAATKFFHFCLTLASCWIFFRLFIFKPLDCVSTVRRHVFLGLPRLRLPSWVQCRAVFVMDSFSFRMPWPIHLQLRCIIIYSTHRSSRVLRLRTGSGGFNDVFLKMIFKELKINCDWKLMQKTDFKRFLKRARVLHVLSWRNSVL